MRLISYLLNLVYCLLLAVVFPIILYRILVQKKYRSGWSQKFLGNLQRRDEDRPCFWFHAVSVGEVLQLPPLLDQIQEQIPNVEFVITTTTHTGFAVAQEKFPQYRICYFPLDFSWAVKRALQRIQPTAVILVEMELWPNFVLAAAELKIPVSIINGRLSEKSFRGYWRIRKLIGPLLNRLHLIATQTETYAERFRSLKGNSECVHVTGSIKFDGIEIERDNPLTAELRNTFQLNTAQTVLVAGSTQAPEERIALDVYLEARKYNPDLRLILVPRHQERFEEVAELVKSYGLPLICRSDQRQGDVSTLLPFSNIETPAIGLLDTLGELKACWGLADVAFVGGSLTRRGGQNMIEPAGYGAALMFGPNTWNFKDVVDALIQHQAVKVIHNQEELLITLLDWLKDPQKAASQGERAQKFVLDQRGATSRTVNVILPLLMNTKVTGCESAA
ncbi:3-deoxy-D-manno-octulosonic acid transferase [Gimesia aquarii]|uniref:3-deoxy-D-manno-octulosonic acid transferase n=1 Tax=Gimesia aquarii TaxID=2527964 RepID=A0A517WWD3_9PLAN|nr:3-deoxy-D-manno-octulosonic acid transferase [Gimesia aquarii]QDU09575.1 3-deoxy-D-manno-octulosonic acid transferase [Gimesia aquarii]